MGNLRREYEILSDQERQRGMWMEGSTVPIAGTLANAAEVVAGHRDLSPPDVALILDCLGITREEYDLDKLSDEYATVKERAVCTWLSIQEVSEPDGHISTGTGSQPRKAS